MDYNFVFGPPAIKTKEDEWAHWSIVSNNGVIKTYVNGV
jgi:hypothetical protein